MPQIPIARDAASVTTDDVTANIFNGLFIGTAGNIKVTTHEGSDVTFNNVGNGEFLPIAVKKIFATGTTASNIIGLKFN